MTTVENQLQHWFGYNKFRPGQRDIVDALLNNNHVIAVLPTGTGKSLCYQLSGYLLEGLVIIVSPLLSLMQDQVEQMKAQGEKRVAAINSFLSPIERRQILANIHLYKFLYVSPEMLLSPNVIKSIQSQKLALLAIDEAHCISQWGYDFRPSYLQLGNIRETLGDPLTLALTATATNAVRDQIRKLLRLNGAIEVVHSIDRPNIFMSVKHVYDDQQKMNYLLRFLKMVDNSAGIIYVQSRKRAEGLSQWLSTLDIGQVAYYHGGLPTTDRILIQQQFKQDQLRIIVATSAFGMGVNKDNVRFVVHYSLPLTIESYIQEIGRAGRDGKQSVALLLFDEVDVSSGKRILDREIPSPDDIHEFLLNKHHKEKYQPIDDFDANKQVLISEICDYLSQNTHLSEAILIDFFQKRKQDKQRKLTTFVEWITLTECRRKHLIEEFDQQLSSSPPHCCDQCGHTLEDIASQVEGTNLQTNPYMGWEKELAILFNRK